MEYTHNYEEIKYYLNNLSNQELCNNTGNILKNEMVIDVIVNRVLNGAASIREIAEGIEYDYALRSFFDNLIREILATRKLNISIFEVERIAKEYILFDIRAEDVLFYGNDDERIEFEHIYFKMEPIYMFDLLDAYPREYLEDTIRYLDGIGYNLDNILLAVDRKISNDITSYNSTDIKYILNLMAPFIDFDEVSERVESRIVKDFLNNYRTDV